MGASMLSAGLSLIVHVFVWSGLLTVSDPSTTFFVRYEWLNALESTQQQVDKDAREAQAKKSKKKKKKEQEEKEADRATLWQALTELEQSSREHLESLYWEEVQCACA